MSRSAPEPWRLTDVLVVGVGGAFGAGARQLLGAVDGAGAAAFPWTTLAINVAGSFLLAALPGLSAVRLRRRVALLLGPGVLGGFTTMSTYSDQTRALLAAGQTVSALTYLGGTLAACVLAVAAARMLVAWPVRRGSL